MRRRGSWALENERACGVGMPWARRAGRAPHWCHDWCPAELSLEGGLSLLGPGVADGHDEASGLVGYPVRSDEAQEKGACIGSSQKTRLDASVGEHTVAQRTHKRGSHGWREIIHLPLSLSACMTPD